MREKVLEKRIDKPLSESSRENINRRLEGLKKESLFDIDYRWNKEGDRLFVNTYKLSWDLFFLKNKLEIYVEYPFYLKPFVESAREKTIKLLEKEIVQLVK